MAVAEVKTPTPTLSVGLTNFAMEPTTMTWEFLLERAVAADQAGVDRVFVVDHVVMGEHLENYEGGKFPTTSDAPWLEPLTVLAAVSSVTQRVRLATGILIAGLRRPVVLAKTLATLDALSGGRVDVGVGVGWQREEYEAAGLRFERRGKILDETLATLKALWAPGATDHTSEELGLDFERVWCEPSPVQMGGPPIWVGGTLNPTTTARIVRFGDGWIPWGEQIVEIEAGIRRVREALVEGGRDPEGFGIQGRLSLRRDSEGRYDLAEGFQRELEKVGPLVEAGVTDFVLGLRLPSDTAQARDLLTMAVADFHTVTGRKG